MNETPRKRWQGGGEPLTYYTLLDRIAVPTQDVLVWARWFETHFKERMVAKTWIGETEISTVFLGIDHAPWSARPEIFETMIFGGPLDEEMWRCSTYDEAEAQHEAAIQRVAEALSQSPPPPPAPRP
jgi:hypothetical protein